MESGFPSRLINPGPSTWLQPDRPAPARTINPSLQPKHPPPLTSLEIRPLVSDIHLS